MPFDEEDNDQPSIKSQRVGLKKVSSQKSIFDSMPKKPTQEDLEKKVKKIQEKDSAYKLKAAELVMQFKKAMEDKTLPTNKSIFSQELEKEILSNMVQLAIDINNDPNEHEGMGSLSWITLLLRNCFSQRDKINKLEYMISQLEIKADPATLSELITKEINRVLDNKKNSE